MRNWKADKTVHGKNGRRFRRPEQVYAVSNDPETGELIYLQNVIMEGILGHKLASNERVEFINGNTLDCRRSNLRLVTEVVN